jgi:hypothetical protein
MYSQQNTVSMYIKLSNIQINNDSKHNKPSSTIIYVIIVFVLKIEIITNKNHYNYEQGLHTGKKCCISFTIWK